MRRLLACVLLLAACKSDPPRPLPAADWSKGASAWPHWKSTGSGTWKQQIMEAVRSDLRNAGMHVLQEPAPGALDMALDVNSDTAFVTATRDDETVDDFNFKFDFLYCIGGFANPDCIAREMVARTIEDPRVAAAMRRARPPVVAGGQKQLAGKLAVLELRNFTKDLTRENAQYFTDVVRSAALKAQPQLEVMTRENLLVLLQASGKDLAGCEGECEVDTGRRIGADAIVSGEIQRLGTLYKLSLRLHDTHEGRLLSSTQASGRSVEELDQSAQQAAADLLTLR